MPVDDSLKLRISRLRDRLRRRYFRSAIGLRYAHFVQKRRLCLRIPTGASAAIIFLTPGNDNVNGGILSIASIARETARLRGIHRAETLLCTLPGDRVLLRYTKFRNDHALYTLPLALAHFRALDRLMIHVPEYAVGRFLSNIAAADRARIATVPDVHFNILVQNIKLVGPASEIAALGRLGRVTCTTAHRRYSTREIRDRLGCPLHALSTSVSPEQYRRLSYAAKRNLMIVSPDPHPRREAVLEALRRRHPRMAIRIIRGLSYEAYRALVGRARWALTFGEGLDNYLVETVFSGGIAFAVHNDDFFPASFAGLPTIYPSWEALERSLGNDLAALDSEATFELARQPLFDACAALYRHEEYRHNLKLFYEGAYTIP